MSPLRSVRCSNWFLDQRDRRTTPLN
jgi:hypothetical protein